MNQKAQQGKGKAEQAMGNAMNDDEMKKKGKKDEAEGRMKEMVTDVRDKMDDTVDDMKRKMKK